MEARKGWNVKGPEKWGKLINPLRNYVERKIPVVNEEAKNIEGRPERVINLSIGDPARYNNFKYAVYALQVESNSHGSSFGGSR